MAGCWPAGQPAVVRCVLMRTALCPHSAVMFGTGVTFRLIERKIQNRVPGCLV